MEQDHSTSISNDSQSEENFKKLSPKENQTPNLK